MSVIAAWYLVPDGRGGTRRVRDDDAGTLPVIRTTMTCPRAQRRIVLCFPRLPKTWPITAGELVELEEP